MDIRRQKCNFPYYHEAHNQIIVAAGGDRKPILWICSGTNPDHIPPTNEEQR